MNGMTEARFKTPHTAMHTPWIIGLVIQKDINFIRENYATTP